MLSTPTRRPDRQQLGNGFITIHIRPRNPCMTQLQPVKTSVTSYWSGPKVPRLPDEGRMIKDRQTKESERPGDTGIEGLQHHRSAERAGDAGSAVRGGQLVSPRHRLEHRARAGEAPAGRRNGGCADPQ